MYENSKILFGVADAIEKTTIKRILIEKNSVVFVLDPFNLEIEIDRSYHSAPFEILNFGSYEPEDETISFNLVEDGCVIFDIGAQLGWYTLTLAKHFPKSRIFSFEPLPTTYQILERNIKRNHIMNVKIQNFGFSDKNSSFDRYCPDIDPISTSEKGIQNKKVQNNIKCQLKKLDDYVFGENLQRLDLIRCNVEGAELQILRGGEDTIRKFLPIIIFELVESWCNQSGYSINDVIQYLDSHDYLCCQAYNGKLRNIREENIKNIEKFNYFFLHKEKHVKLIAKYLEK